MPDVGPLTNLKLLRVLLWSVRYFVSDTPPARRVKLGVSGRRGRFRDGASYRECGSAAYGRDRESGRNTILPR